MRTVRIGYLSTIYHTSHIIQHRPWLDGLSVNASWRLFGTGPAMVEAFAAGDIDLGYIGLPPAMIGIDRGVPLRCIAGGHVEGTIMIAGSSYAPLHRLDSLQAVLSQFAGKKIGSPARGSIHDVIIRFLLRKFQIEGIEVINFPWADLIPAAIDEAEIDGAVGTPQLAVVARLFYGQEIVLPPDSLWRFSPSYGIVVREELLKEADLLQEFLQLHEKACNFMRLQPEKAAALLAGENRAMSPDFILKTCAISPKYCASLPDEYIQSTLEFVPVLKNMGYLKRSLTREDIFDCSFIEATHPEPHHYSEITKDKKY
jgi:NitT/TauT family transport system substrate-binding protein